MNDTIRILNDSRGGLEISAARWCRSFWCRLWGLMLRADLPQGRALLLDERTDSRLASAIHMLGMRMDLGVIWINSQWLIVDMVHARPWRFYWPAEPARYVLEGSPAMLKLAAVGDQTGIESV